MRNAKTPEERAQATQEHRKAMRELMQQMAGGQSAMGPGNGAGTAGGAKKDRGMGAGGEKGGMSMNMMGDGGMGMMNDMMGCMMGKMMKGQKVAQKRLQQMERRMAMMEQMMRHMMDNEDPEREMEGH